MRRPRFSQEMKRWGYLILFLYVVLLGVSHFYLRDKGESDPLEEDPARKVIDAGGKRLAYLEWGGANPSLPPLILVHGSPGRGGRDWEKLATELALGGRRVIAIDRWGYGASERKVDDYSFEADKEAVLSLMDQLGIKRAHVGGWSYGGGPAILLGSEAGDRIASVSLIAAVGIQEGEGSGSYVVEHVKYAALNLLVNWLPELIPHFGLLGAHSRRRAFARDFMDCDQRPLKRKLTTMETPLILIHGKNDPLIPAWVAQEHHRLRPASRLVVLDASHFFVFGAGKTGRENENENGNFEIATRELAAFLTAVDEGRAADRKGVRNETSRQNLRALWDGGPPMRGYKPWGVILLVGIAIGFFIPRTGSVILGMAGGLLLLDPLTAITGVLFGGVIKREEYRTRYHKAGLIALLGVLGAIVGALLLPVL